MDTTSPTELLAKARASLSEPMEALGICHVLLESTAKGPDIPTLTLAEQCDAHTLRGHAHRLLGDFAEAETDLLYAKQLAQQIAEDKLFAMASMQLGLLAMERGEHDSAIRLLTTAVDLFERGGNALLEAQARFSLANAYWQDGQTDLSMTTMERALLDFTDLHSQDGMVAVMCALVRIDCARNKFNEALKRIELCLNILPPNSDPKNRLFLNLALALCCSRTGNTDRALNIVEAAVQSAHEGGYHYVEAQGSIMWHRILIEQQKAERAAELLERARDLAHRFGFEEALDKMIAEPYAL